MRVYDQLGMVFPVVLYQLNNLLREVRTITQELTSSLLELNQEYLIVLV